MFKVDTKTNDNEIKQQLNWSPNQQSFAVGEVNIFE